MSKVSFMGPRFVEPTLTNDTVPAQGRRWRGGVPDRWKGADGCRLWAGSGAGSADGALQGVAHLGVRRELGIDRRHDEVVDDLPDARAQPFLGGARS